ncbi:MAG: hypothetical protein VZR33_04100 [Methanosphaera sp.]|uniref:hypothetical protein n=1 Tax=Methanosphaera sp. TaxID=2666342 RepID=UPI002E77FA44|nr:hypothetical protein [Methanosphaera sp.]MEE1117695.1 hypothetical protein [Methanosphaera sp.]MEE3324496.1 hypothetical protein [Methanosphaera sp.]MEE3417978.1 hypothetical protein [Methanosphaera sp.]
MLENMGQNKIRTLEPKRNFIVNDIKIKDYNLASVATIITVSSLFLLSMKLVVLTV